MLFRTIRGCVAHFIHMKIRPFLRSNSMKFFAEFFFHIHVQPLQKPGKTDLWKFIAEAQHHFDTFVFAAGFVQGITY